MKTTKTAIPAPAPEVTMTDNIRPDVTGTDSEAGLATAEYAVITIAAVGFAGLLVALLKSPAAHGLIEQVMTTITNALAG